jgi:two-component system alkaline phosphatase synthesis response regulator PhoP
MSGMDILKWIRKSDQETPVMIVSALQSEMDKVIALDQGADDYMTKPFGVLELTSRMQSKLRKFGDDKHYQMGNVLLDDRKHTVLVNEEMIYLTNKEYDILKLLLKNQRNVVSKETIFRDVWDTDYIGETRTLDMHIKSLRQKLITQDASIKITTVRGVGFQLE